MSLLWTLLFVVGAPPVVMGGDVANTVDVDQVDDRQVQVAIGELPVLVVEDEATVVPEPEPKTLAVKLYGRLSERLSADLSWSPGETVVEARTSMELGMSAELSECLSFAIEGRLRHRLRVFEGESGTGANPGGQGESVVGLLETELRRLSATWRPDGGPELVVGLQTVRWGRTTLSRPFDLVSPADWRDGPVGRVEEQRLPVVALAARLALGQGQLEAVYVPFFVAARMPLLGESAPTLSDSAEAALRDAGVDDIEDFEGPRQDFIASGEVGVRLTQRIGDLDLGLGWLWRRDRIPGPSGHERQHALGLDLSTRLGPVRLTAEGAMLVDRRVWRPDGVDSPDPVSEHHLGIDWAFELQTAPTVYFDVVAGLGGRHLPGASGRFLGAGPDEVWFDLRLELLLAFDGLLRLDTELRFELLRVSHHVMSGLAVRATEDFQLTLGVLVFGGEAESGGLSALYRATSHAWLEAVFAF